MLTYEEVIFATMYAEDVGGSGDGGDGGSIVSRGYTTTK